MSTAETKTVITRPEILKNDRFQHGKGYFYIDEDCIMTKSQIVTIMDNYVLLEFTDNQGGIRERPVVFWHAMIKDNFLKIIVYDNVNKVVVQRMHDLTKPRYENDWFLIEEQVIADDLLEFDF